MLLFSRCRSCGEKMIVTEPAQYWHDGCPPKPTRAEEAAQKWQNLILEADTRKWGDPPPGLYAEIEALERDIEAMDAVRNLTGAAIAYANYGWPVFPLMEHSKIPATKTGFKDATTDLNRVAQWWDQRPKCNIGLATGHAFDVIDVDVRSGGVQSWLTVQDLPSLPDAHGRVATASGGFHLYVQPTGRGNRAGIYPGIDYRGKGGYVVAPPSTLGPRERSWSWSVYPSNDIIPTLTKEAAAHGN